MPPRKSGKSKPAGRAKAAADTPGQPPAATPADLPANLPVMRSTDEVPPQSPKSATPSYGVELVSRMTGLTAPLEHPPQVFPPANQQDYAPAFESPRLLAIPFAAPPPPAAQTVAPLLAAAPIAPEPSLESPRPPARSLSAPQELPAPPLAAKPPRSPDRPADRPPVAREIAPQPAPPPAATKVEAPARVRRFGAEHARRCACRSRPSYPSFRCLYLPAPL